MKNTHFFIFAFMFFLLSPSLMFGGQRTDIKSYSSSQRTQLKNLILAYAGQNNNAVINQYQNAHYIYNNYASEFLTWHRTYIEGLETYLNNNGGSAYVPLPSWNPADSIPDEFYNNAVLPGYDDLYRQCPSGLNFYNFSRFASNDLCTAYEGNSLLVFCGIPNTDPLDKLGADLQCENKSAEIAIGGVLEDMQAPAAAIFWLVHAYFDDIYYDYEQGCQSFCSLTTSKALVKAPPTASTQNFYISSTGSWTASADVPWITLNTSAGIGNGTFTFTLAYNLTSSSRAGTITVTCGSTTRTIAIIQLRNSACTLSLSNSTPIYPSSSGTKTIFVYSTAAWTASENVSWITLNNASGSGNGSLSFTLVNNISSFTRTGTITVTCGSTTETITINQRGNTACTLSVSPSNIYKDRFSETRSVSVNSTGSWNATENVSWISLNTTSGSGNGTLSFYISANNTFNSRIGIISLSCGSTDRIIRVRQEGQIIIDQCPPREICPFLPRLSNTATTTQLTNIPNPFQSSTTIQYTLEADSEISLNITDVSGRTVAQPVVKEAQTTGTHRIKFEAEDLSPGLYFYTLQTGNERITKQMVITR